jgi:hypothetical protein
MKRKDTASRREAMQALEAIFMSLALWHASRGSVAEPRCDKMMRDLAENAFKAAKPAGVLQIEAILTQWMKEEADKVEGSSVAGGTTAAHEERDLEGRGEQVEAVVLPGPGGGDLAGSPKAEMDVRTEGVGLEDP